MPNFEDSMSNQPSVVKSRWTCLTPVTAWLFQTRRCGRPGAIVSFGAGGWAAHLFFRCCWPVDCMEISSLRSLDSRTVSSLGSFDWNVHRFLRYHWTKTSLEVVSSDSIKEDLGHLVLRAYGIPTYTHQRKKSSWEFHRYSCLACTMSFADELEIWRCSDVFIARMANYIRSKCRKKTFPAIISQPGCWFAPRNSARSLDHEFPGNHWRFLHVFSLFVSLLFASCDFVVPRNSTDLLPRCTRSFGSKLTQIRLEFCPYKGCKVATWTTPRPEHVMDSMDHIQEPLKLMFNGIVCLSEVLTICHNKLVLLHRRKKYQVSELSSNWLVKYDILSRVCDKCPFWGWGIECDP